MKFLVFNRQFLLLSMLLLTAFSRMTAQIESTHTDEKYNFTTVVYKDKAASDKEVLAKLDHSIGMGDVIRVTVAPPKPAVAPVADKAKGEDTWLKPVKMPINTLTAATGNIPVNNTPAAAPGAAPHATGTNMVITAPLAVIPVVKPVLATPNQVVIQEQKLADEKMAAATKTEKTKPAVASKTTKKAVKKSSKKSGKTFKAKKRKGGKQRYGCPKF